MKKFTLFASSLLVLASLSSCSENDDPKLNPDNPKISNGAYFLTQGNYYDMVPGGLYALDYKTDVMASDVFKNANGGQDLGNTPQCGMVYGSKMYLGIFGSNCIFILDKNTYKTISRISLDNSENGTQPRSMVAHGGKVYISMFDGYVARLDTVSQSIEASVKVGLNPEKIAIYDNKLYVPNSEGMSTTGFGTTASVIDLKTFTVTSTLTVPLNPTTFISNNTGLYLLCMGNYSDIAAKLYKVEGTTCKEIAPATMVAAGKESVYFINAPFYGSVNDIEYKIYQDGIVQDWGIDKVAYPSAIAADALSDRIFISSYVMSGNYPSYSLPGYVNEYDSSNKFIKKFDIGAGEPAIFFDKQ